MDQLLSVWTGLTLRRRVIVVAATLGMLVSVLILAKIASAPRMSLLYAGLDATTAGEVVEAVGVGGDVVELLGDAVGQLDDALLFQPAAEGTGGFHQRGHQSH